MRKSGTILWILLFVLMNDSYGQRSMENISGRKSLSLNGSWQVLIDPVGAGDYKEVWKERKPTGKSDFVEYSFDEGLFLKVPGDFNSQLAELSFYEGIVWYKKEFRKTIIKGNRYFLYFGGVNYLATVYLNGVKVGKHEGGFTPFQFEITDLIKEGLNTVIVKVDNHRPANGLPGAGYDWYNYGGITRDVALIETAGTFIRDYFVQLKKGSLNTIRAWVKLDGKAGDGDVRLSIPEIGFRSRLKTDHNGYAEVEFKATLDLWSPGDPKRYQIVLEYGAERLVDTIGFRCIETIGRDVLLNGKKLFLKSVNIHEENPMEKRRCIDKTDALVLLSAAKELGCNMIRLVHYPHNEATVRLAEEMGILVWDELPVYQHISFSDSLVPSKLKTMLDEMIGRDKNRCAVIVWSLSNETYPGTPQRNSVLADITKACRSMDSSRLVVHVANTQGYSYNVVTVWDSIYEHSDLVALNEYFGWYLPFQGDPGETKWRMNFPDKPVFISEFGGEALFGNRAADTTSTPVWTEEYQYQIYKDQTRLFETIPGLCGVSPWLLFDYRSPSRMNQVYQKGYNRKGLLSDKGDKKMAWFVIYDYFNSR